MQSSVSLRRLACSEFPNDNPQLHDGALWIPLAIGEPPSCVFPSQAPRVEMLPPPAPEAEERAVEMLAEDEDDDAEPIEIVDDLDFDGGFDGAIDEPSRDDVDAYALLEPRSSGVTTRAACCTHDGDGSEVVGASSRVEGERPDGEGVRGGPRVQAVDTGVLGQLLADGRCRRRAASEDA
jgi:hypothetical protein